MGRIRPGCTRWQSNLNTRLPWEKWKGLRDEIHEQICTKAFSKSKNSFMQAYGSKQLDAAMLLMPLVGFLPGDDPRVIGTVEAIERELMHDLVSVHQLQLGEGGRWASRQEEGVFLACSFWLVSSPDGDRQRTGRA